MFISLVTLSDFITKHGGTNMQIIIKILSSLPVNCGVSNLYPFVPSYVKSSRMATQNYWKSLFDRGHPVVLLMTIIYIEVQSNTIFSACIHLE